MTTVTIPPAETAERDVFNSTILGTLHGGRFYCLECRRPEEEKYPVRVYGINLAPYSAVCAACGALVLDGSKKSDGTPLCCFD